MDTIEAQIDNKANYFLGALSPDLHCAEFQLID
jgi:hypothetical protein